MAALRGVARIVKFRSLRTKLLVVFIALTALPLGFVSLLAAQRSHDALEEKTGAFLQTQAQEIGDKIDRNLFERYGDVQAFAFNPMASGSGAEQTAAADFYTRAYGVYDLMVVTDAQGIITAANTVTFEGEPLDTSALIGRDVSGEAWWKDAMAAEPATTIFGDPAPDPLVDAVMPGAGLELAFSAPIRDAGGDPIGVWSNRASWERVVGQILDEARAQLVEKGVTTAQTLLTDRDGVVLADSVADGLVGTDLDGGGLALGTALGEADASGGHIVSDDLRDGTSFVTGYARTDGALGFPGYGFGVAVAEERGEAGAAAAALRRSLLGAAAIALAIAVACAVLVARSIVRPVRRTVDALTRIADGDLTARLTVESRDEVGQLAVALNSTAERVGAAIEGIARSADELASASEELTAVSSQLAAGAEQTSTRAVTVSEVAGRISESVTSIATGAEQMSASIQEIAHNTGRAAEQARDAVEVSRSTAAAVAELGAASTEIEEVVQLITSIAEQTNLLALNATIEAARAGEAGEGFAVVAAEVKDLAQETARATEGITDRVTAIQRHTSAAVEAIDRIRGVIDQISEAQHTIASACEEQTATTVEMSRTTSDAASGSSEIVASISEVTEAARAASVGAEEARNSAQNVARTAEHLRELVSHFQC